MWNSTTGGSWGDIAAWNPGTAATGADNTADFSRKTLTSDATVSLNGARVIGHLVFGDVGAARNWTLNAGSGGNLTLQVTAGTPKVTVNNQTATIDAVLTGTQGLTKAGAGTLVLNANNTYTGGTTIDAGTLVTASDANLGAGTLTINAGTLRSTGSVTNARQIILGNAAAAIQVDGAASYTVGAGGSISGTGGLTKLGTGTLNLSAATTNYSGPTTVNAGTLNVGAFGNTAAVTVSTGASLNVTGTNLTLGSVTNAGIANFVGNTGTITIPTLAGTGTTTFAGNAAITTVGGGTINFNGPTATVGTLNSANVALNAGSALSVGSGTQTSGTITGSGSLTKTGTGTLVLGSDNAYTGGTTISGGTLQLGNGGTSGSIAGNVANNGTLAVNRTDAYTLAGAISGTGSLTMSGTGTLTLTGNNTFSGGTTISAGTLAVGAGSNLGTGTISIAAGTLRATANIASPLPIGLKSTTSAINVDATATYSVTSGAAVSGTGGLTKLGSGVLDLSAAAVSYSGTTSVSAGTLNVGNFSNTAQLTVASGATMNLSGASVTLGTLSNSGTVAFTNPAAAVALSSLGGTGTTSFAGAVTIPTFNGGTINVFGPATLTTATSGVANLNGPTASINNLSNTTLTLGASTALTVASGTQTAGGISGAGSLTKSGAGTLLLGFDNAYSGGTTVAGGVLQIGNAGTTGSIIGNVSNNGSVVFNRADALTFAGLISGSGSFTQNGIGVLTLTGQNTFTGGTTVARGTLQFGDGTNAGSVTGNVSNLGTVVFNTPAAGQTFPGSISGTGAISKIGAGTQVLTGTNTATGGLTISAGKLQIGNGGTAGSLVGNVTNNARLVFNRSDNVTFGGTITGTGQVEQAGTGTLLLSASVDNGLIATRGRVVVGASTILNGDVTVATNGRVENGGGVLRIGNLDNAGIVSGTADLTGTFTNRASGDVRLAAGQRMFVQGTGGHSNAGLIEVLGSNASPAEFESVGAFVNVGGGTGMIVGRNASLRMDAGLANAGVLSFNYGQNDVFGDINNQNGGTITVAGGAGVTFYDDVVQNGSLVVSATGSTVSSAVFLGGFSGAGGFTGGGDVFFMGDLRPGNSPANVACSGNLYLAPSTHTVIELGGTQRGTQYDALTVAGDATLNGWLDLTRLNGYAPAPLAQHRIVSATSMNGAFSSITGTSIDSRTAWAVTYDNAGVNVTATILGDANVDGVVNFADLLALARHYRQTTSDTGWIDGDYNYDKTVDFNDLLILARNYQRGVDQLPSSLEPSLQADWTLAQSMVPEPTTAVAALAAGVLLAGQRGRRRTAHH